MKWTRNILVRRQCERIYTVHTIKAKLSKRIEEKRNTLPIYITVLCLCDAMRLQRYVCFFLEKKEREINTMTQWNCAGRRWRRKETANATCVYNSWKWLYQLQNVYTLLIFGIEFFGLVFFLPCAIVSMCAMCRRVCEHACYMCKKVEISFPFSIWIISIFHWIRSFCTLPHAQNTRTHTHTHYLSLTVSQIIRIPVFPFFSLSAAPFMCIFNEKYFFTFFVHAPKAFRRWRWQNIYRILFARAHIHTYNTHYRVESSISLKTVKKCTIVFCV